MMAEPGKGRAKLFYPRSDARCETPPAKPAPNSRLLLPLLAEMRAKSCFVSLPMGLPFSAAGTKNGARPHKQAAPS